MKVSDGATFMLRTYVACGCVRRHSYHAGSGHGASNQSLVAMKVSGWWRCLQRNLYACRFRLGHGVQTSVETKVSIRRHSECRRCLDHYLTQVL